MQIKNLIVIFLVGILIPRCQTAPGNADFSFDQYKIEDGFEMQLIAAEPLIQAPVAMDFDNEGRIWVVEMRGYMPNIAGTGEDNPNGRISILGGLDKKGRAHHAKTFLDSLVLPRALALVYGGLLYSAPPNLWFVEIDNDRPGKKTLVDSTYSDAYSDPENQANGLMMGIDNWIYSAHSSSRYQLKDGKWIKEPTSHRGQFGITKDNFGRLYYNYNPTQLVGDYVLPGALISNPYFKPKSAVNQKLTANQNVYPLHSTTVNRGYMEGILNQDSILKEFTAACGPLIYRGDQFPADYSQNAFTCEPQGNLIKRNILSFEGLKTTAVQAWDDREFVASTDEGFRPVNLVNGPDGAMYVVDMHRGVMQHIISATPYYKKSIVDKKLDTLLNAGRILRIRHKDKGLGKIPGLANASAGDLVSLLESNNGWIRDRAQQMIIYKQEHQAAPGLKRLIEEGENTIAAIHALHTLEGLNALSFEFLEKVAASGKPELTAHALLLLEKYYAIDNIKPFEKLAIDLMNRNDTVVNLYLALSLGSWISASHETFLPILAKLSDTYPDNAVFQEAVMSSLKDQEENFKSYIIKAKDNKTTSEIRDSLLVQTIRNKKDGIINPIFIQKKPTVDVLNKGLNIFRSVCSSCHGAEGEGIAHAGPPLNGSEYLSGSGARLAMIILNGLKGPIHVKGQRYEFDGIMPDFRNNFTDDEIEGIIVYLRNSFVAGESKRHNLRPKAIKAEEIRKLRNKPSGILTEKDLLEMAD
ncbi:MAG TPA: c-type cytochrome [Flavitalea sp.]|nr:c-type cytochrome [Flavitalea sp.]